MATIIVVDKRFMCDCKSCYKAKLCGAKPIAYCYFKEVR